jgi:hypothetical protein
MRRDGGDAMRLLVAIDLHGHHEELGSRDHHLLRAVIVSGVQK